MIGRLFAIRPHRGQAMVEFAMVATVLMLLTMGIVDFSRAIWSFNTLAHLAREGARYGSAPSRTSVQIQNYAVTRAVLPDLSTSNVSVTRGVCGNTNSPVVVTLNYPFHAASGMIAGLWGGGALNLHATASMYVEKGVPSVDCACGGPCS
jgi:Flp pilus assembly protein TadG